MPSRNTIVVGVIAVIVVVGAGFWYWQVARTTTHGVTGFQYPISGVWESNGGSDGTKEEFWLAPKDASISADGQLLNADTTSGTLYTNTETTSVYFCGNDTESWQVSDTNIVLYCGYTQAHTLSMNKKGQDITLIDTTNGRVFTRQKTLPFDYKEEGKDKRLTLYEIPGEHCHACSGYLWGVFEEADQAGKFSIATITQPFSAIGSYGRVSTADTIAKDLNSWNKSASSLLTTIGKNKLAVVFSFGDMGQGFVSSGAWILEYSDNKLAYRGLLFLHEDNFGICSDTLKKRDSETGEEPCASYDGTFSIGNSSITPNSDYYDITVKTNGTKYDYNKDKVIPVNTANVYIFDKSTGEYALTK